MSDRLSMITGRRALARMLDHASQFLPGNMELIPVSGGELERARRWFTAFGTCSVAEPRGGLQVLGMLDG